MFISKTCIMTWLQLTLLGSYILTTLGYSSDNFNVEIYLSNSIQNVLSKASQMQQFTEMKEKVLSDYTNNNATLNDTVMEKVFEKIMQEIPDEVVIPNYKVDDEVLGYNIKVYTKIFSSKISNLSNYNIDNVNIIMSNNDPVCLETWFTFPSWSIVGNYELDVTSPDIHVFGVGPFSIFFNNTKLYTRSNFSLTARKNLNMTDFAIIFTIGSSEVKFEQMFNDSSASELLNSLLSVAMPMGVFEFQEEIQKFLKDLVIPSANLFFAFFSVPDLIVFINYFIS